MPLYLQNFGFADTAGLFINPAQVLSMVPVTGTNAVGNDMTFHAGQGTGTGIGGSFIFKVAGAGSSGSGSNTLSDALTIASDKSVTAYGDLTVTGNLTVSGTMTTIDSTTVTVEDPVFYLAKGQYSDTSTKLDRGIIADYNDGASNKLMFFGYDRTQDLFTFIPDATDSTADDGLTDGNFAGTPGAAKFGDLTIGSGTATGVLQSHGDNNLKLQTGNATTGYIEIVDGANGDINIIPNGSGQVILGGAYSSVVQHNAQSLDFNAAQSVSIDAGAASNFTTSAGTLTLNGFSGVAIEGNASEIGINTTANLVLESDVFTLNTTSTVDIDATGALSLNSSGDVINIGDDNVAQNISVGTAGARTIAVGSSSATAVNVDAVSISLDATAASNFTVTASNDGDDFTIAQAGSNDSSLILSSSGTGADALQLTASAGGMVMKVADESALTMGNTDSDAYFKVHASATSSSEVVSVVNTNGDANGAIAITASAGGMELTSAKTMAIATSANDANVSITAHGTGAVTMANRRLIVNDTNIRDSMEHVEIVPCDSSVFGTDNLAPLVMTAAPYNGWRATNSHTSRDANDFNRYSATINWTIAPPADLDMADVEFITICVKYLAVDSSPLFYVKINDSTYEFYIDNMMSDPPSVGQVVQFVMPISGTYSPTAPANKYGHERSELLRNNATWPSSGSISNMVISALGTNAFPFDFIVNSVNFVTNLDVGTLSYKFTNDSVVQAQSAQAISALYNYWFRVNVSQTTPGLIDQTSESGYVGTANAYGDTNVLANYTLRRLVYTNTSYSVSSSAASGTVVATAPTATSITPTAYSMTAVSGLTINSTTGAITTDGNTLTAGSTSVTVTATDANGQTAASTIVIAVSA